MIEIDGPLWFASALLICGAHVLYLRGWRREYRQILGCRQKYNADAQKRHDEFMHAMRAIGRDDADTLGWNLSSSGERGQA